MNALLILTLFFFSHYNSNSCKIRYNLNDSMLDIDINEVFNATCKYNFNTTEKTIEAENMCNITGYGYKFNEDKSQVTIDCENYTDIQITPIHCPIDSLKDVISFSRNGCFKNDTNGESDINGNILLMPCPFSLKSDYSFKNNHTIIYCKNDSKTNIKKEDIYKKMCNIPKNYLKYFKNNVETIEYGKEIQLKKHFHFQNNDKKSITIMCDIVGALENNLSEIKENKCKLEISTDYLKNIEVCNSNLNFTKNCILRTKNKRILFELNNQDEIELSCDQNNKVFKKEDFRTKFKTCTIEKNDKLLYYCVNENNENTDRNDQNFSYCDISPTEGYKLNYLNETNIKINETNIKIMCNENNKIFTQNEINFSAYQCPVNPVHGVFVFCNDEHLIECYDDNKSVLVAKGKFLCEKGYHYNNANSTDIFCESDEKANINPECVAYECKYNQLKNVQTIDCPKEKFTGSCFLEAKNGFYFKNTENPKKIEISCDGKDEISGYTEPVPIECEAKIDPNKINGNLTSNEMDNPKSYKPTNETVIIKGKTTLKCNKNSQIIINGTNKVPSFELYCSINEDQSIVPPVIPNCIYKSQTPSIIVAVLLLGIIVTSSVVFLVLYLKNNNKLCFKPAN